MSISAMRFIGGILPQIDKHEFENWCLLPLDKLIHLEYTTIISNK